MNYIFVIFGVLGYVLAENCDQLGVLLYEDLQCAPVKKSGQACPERFDCNFGTQKSTGCLFKGRFYEDSEEIDRNLTYSACSVGCHCSNGEIECAILDCPEWLGRRAEPGCHLKFELGKCCSVGQVCPTAATEKQCEVDGKKYGIGEKFTREQNTCQQCVCHEDFNGDFDQKTCMRVNCATQIRNTESIKNKCAVAYFNNIDENLCCPDHWICPEASDEIKIMDPSKTEQPDLKCDYGDKKLNIGEGFSRTINKWGKNRDIKCECVLPPFVTCWQIKGTDE